MEEKNNKNSFHYSYSAREQKEIQSIRQKYTPSAEPENKLEQLRRLDAGVTKKGTVVSLIFGVLGTILLGIGMCCCMVWGNALQLYILGITVGTLGIISVGLAYPLYTHITKRERQKIAPEIIRLTDELIK